MNRQGQLLRCVATSVMVLVLFLCLGLPAPGAENPNYDKQRKDNVFGTVNEGIIMETDPDTGDRIIQVTPPPQQEEEQPQSQPLIIQPEIRIKR